MSQPEPMTMAMRLCRRFFLLKENPEGIRRCCLGNSTFSTATSTTERTPSYSIKARQQLVRPSLSGLQQPVSVIQWHATVSLCLLFSCAYFSYSSRSYSTRRESERGGTREGPNQDAAATMLLVGFSVKMLGLPVNTQLTLCFMQVKSFIQSFAFVTRQN